MASMSESHLNCEICLDVATEAVDSDCCHHLFCSVCVQNVTVCPVCRNATVRYTANHVLRRIIGDLPVSCDFAGCTAAVTRSNADSHRKNCPFGTLTCPINGCETKMLPAELIPHLVARHKLAEGKSLLTATRNQPATIYHTGVTCDGCGQRPIQNRRHKCLICPDYDLCDNCEGLHIHEQHLMMRIADSTNTSWKDIVKGTHVRALLSIPFAATSSSGADNSNDDRSASLGEPFAATLAALTSMGFSNEDGSLYRLIESKEGDINEVLSSLSQSPTRSVPLTTNPIETASSSQHSGGRRDTIECSVCGMRLGSRLLLFEHIRCEHYSSINYYQYPMFG